MWDYDAMQPSALVDISWQGQPRKLLVQANRNGYFYVLDRTNGKFLLGNRRQDRHVGVRTDAGGPSDRRARHGADT